MAAAIAGTQAIFCPLPAMWVRGGSISTNRLPRLRCQCPRVVSLSLPRMQPPLLSSATDSALGSPVSAHTPRDKRKSIPFPPCLPSVTPRLCRQYPALRFGAPTVHIGTTFFLPCCATGDQAGTACNCYLNAMAATIPILHKLFTTLR
jgi:hypothetical protein